ncbi:MAG: CRISPR-associated endonuclease Cas2 [Candidatus Aenigmatarchaeota archaeon]
MVYVIVVYDIAVERQNKVREFLKRYLDHVQNSVFEGEIRESDLFYISEYLKVLINEEEDSVIIYVLPTQSSINRKIVIGQEKPKSFII